MISGSDHKRRKLQKAQRTSLNTLVDKFTRSQSVTPRNSQIPVNDDLAQERELYSPMEGRADARQLSESAEDFIKHVSPLSSAALGPWLWVYNLKARDADKVEDEEANAKACALDSWGGRE